MVKYESRCCDCSSPLYQCKGDLCELQHIKIYKCDLCGDEVEYGELFDFDGQELCIECVAKQLDIIE